MFALNWIGYKQLHSIAVLGSATLSVDPAVVLLLLDYTEQKIMHADTSSCSLLHNSYSFMLST
jgi:hypothetical protein